jgi:hypothetical protein
MSTKISSSTRYLFKAGMGCRKGEDVIQDGKSGSQTHDTGYIHIATALLSARVGRGHPIPILRRILPRDLPRSLPFEVTNPSPQRSTFYGFGKGSHSSIESCMVRLRIAASSQGCSLIGHTGIPAEKQEESVSRLHE